jgi:uncharacterized phiE125 gp8 family phage protein
VSNLPAPTYEPVSLEEARLQCKIDAFGSPPSHPDDLLLELFISAAREWAEQYTGLALGGRTLEMALTAFPAEITFPYGPVIGIAYITYLDKDGLELVVPAADYQLDTFSTPARVILAPDATWPDDVGTQTNGIRVFYAVGYSAPGESPQDNPMPRSIKVALLLTIGHLYKNREASSQAALTTIPMGATCFLDTVKIRRGFA